MHGCGLFGLKTCLRLLNWPLRLLSHRSRARSACAADHQHVLCSAVHSLRVQFDSLAAAAAHMGLDAAVLQQQVGQYNEGAAANSDAHGKQYFPPTIDAAGAVWVGQVTPVVHYCMGGLKIDDSAQVCGL